ncbi:MAG: LuxR C-terminal-related transcriptional regulator [Chloroflexota bacterium]|nr:LuxR C-terminal-related transcriptional regulator [Chloroflexota bacterium]
MSQNLLRTKFYIPAPPASLVSRPQLISIMDEGLRMGSKLTLISAPAGYGKTTLLSEWIHNQVQHGVHAAWLSMQKADEDPVRFWIYFMSALRTIPVLRQKGVGEAALAIIQVHESRSIEGALISLINDLAGTDERIILALDDLHLITDRDIHSGLYFFLEHLSSGPNGLHLAVTTRRDPPWPKARLRSRGELTEIRVQSLRFSTDEVNRFLNQALGLDLSAKNISELDERTEGWIAGIQMAAISIQGRERTTSGASVEDFIESYSGSHRFVLDYLLEEVLEQQTPDVREFLLKTSILDRLTAPLCDAVCYCEGDTLVKEGSGSIGGKGSQNLLDYLEQANLFISPMDDRRQWYRYHRLFSDLLQMRLKQTQPDEIEKLHNRASLWFETKCWIAEAVRHAFAADDMANAARLIEENTFTMLDLGEMATLLAWLDRIPDNIRRKRPWLGISNAWFLVYAGRLDSAEEVLLQVEKSLSGRNELNEQQVNGHIEAIRAYAAWIRSEGERAAAHARRALLLLPQDELTVRALAGTTLANGLIQCGDLAGAFDAGVKAVEVGQASGNSHVYMLATSSLAYLLILRGQFYQAENICNKALESADNHSGQPMGQSPAVAQVYAMLSAVKLERFELEEALKLARTGLELSKNWAQADTLTLNYVYLVDALITGGYLDEARTAVEQVRRVGAHVSVWFANIVGQIEARLYLAENNLAAAKHWVEESGIGFQDDFSQPDWSTYRTLAGILRVEGKFSEAFQLLDNLIVAVEDAGANSYLVSLLSLKAVVLAEMNDKDQAVVVLERALVLAAPERIIRSILAGGDALIPLLRDAAIRGSTNGFVRELLIAKETRGGVDKSILIHEVELQKSGAVDLQFALIDPLTEREVEVLRMLNSQLSIPEIAQELYIAPSTVRSHVRSIYSKLDVHGRIEAILRAQELNLI